MPRTTTPARRFGSDRPPSHLVGVTLLKARRRAIRQYYPSESRVERAGGLRRRAFLTEPCAGQLRFFSFTFFVFVCELPPVGL